MIMWINMKTLSECILQNALFEQHHARASITLLCCELWFSCKNSNAWNNFLIYCTPESNTYLNSITSGYSKADFINIARWTLLIKYKIILIIVKLKYELTCTKCPLWLVSISTSLLCVKWKSCMISAYLATSQ